MEQSVNGRDMSKPSYNNNQQQPHRPTRFFLIVSLFVIAMSILAVYSTITASEYGLKKDDMHTHAIVHLVKSNDWLNDYEEQKLGEQILQSQIDNVNITLQNNNSVNHILLLKNKPMIIFINTDRILMLCIQTNQLMVHWQTYNIKQN